MKDIMDHYTCQYKIGFIIIGIIYQIVLGPSFGII